MNLFTIINLKGRESAIEKVTETETEKNQSSSLSLSQPLSYLRLDKTGFTLIEVVVVVALIGILVSIAYSTLRTPNEKIVCKEIYSEMQLAKMEAVSTEVNVLLNVDSALNAVENVSVPEEVTYQTTAVTVPSAPLHSGWPAWPNNGIDFDGAGGTVVTFTPKGMATNSGSVYFKDAQNTSRICAVSVLTTGIVKMATSNDGGASWN